MLHEAQRRDLCEKIARWRGWNAFNEEATIQGIVLPILELVGYDTRNPEEVLPQARDIQGNKPDLMLYKTSPLSNGVEWCVIEAKALGKPLNNYVAQVGQYLIASNAQWYVLTDGFEWRFFDKNHPQNNFYRAAITLEMPGALEALCCLLDKARPAPDFDCAFQTLIEARLREAARQVEWEKHCTAWELTGQLVIPLQKAVAELSSQFDQEQIISRWIQNFKQHLQEQVTPPWWEETNPVMKESMTVSEKDNQIGRFSLQQIADSGFQVEFTYPNALWIGEEKVVLDRMKSWKSVVRAVIRALDDQGYLPPPPYYPFAKGFILYADTPTLFKRSVVINSSRYGTLYVNQGECTADRSARALFSLVKEAQCPQISPSSIYLELHRWSP